MGDFYHFFGIKDKQNRFMMRLVNPFGFNIAVAQIKLQELFSTHGVCPANNEVTWSPWNAGKSIYQFWYVTPNKLGLIKSATPTLTLDGVSYKGLPTYLLSLDDYTKVYANQDSFPSRWADLSFVGVGGKFSDFIPVNIGELDTANMTGIFINSANVSYNWNIIKPWIENGYIFIDGAPDDLTNPPFSNSYLSVDIGDYVIVIVNDVELSPIYNKPASFPESSAWNMRFTGVSPPAGWSTRTLVETDRSGVRHAHVIELVHDASGGRYIALGSDTARTMMPDWWYPIVVLQYPLMKFNGVAAYYTE